VKLNEMVEICRIKSNKIEISCWFKKMSALSLSD